jgi:cytochrome bd-type quinol oxidase subunit 2
MLVVDSYQSPCRRKNRNLSVGMLSEGKMKSVRRWLALWWISWFGIIGGFLMVGIDEYRHESTTASHFSIILMIVTVLLWIVFFIADDRARKRITGEAHVTVVVDLLTITGTFLAVFTLLGIGFFIVIAPRVP